MPVHASVASASVPARASLPSPPRERSVCQDACVSQHTLRAGAQHSGRRETRVRRRYTSHSYGWCADAHHLRPRRCMDSNPQLVMRCAGTQDYCRPRRCVDSNHRRVIRCADAPHHPRPSRCMDSNHQLVLRCAGAHQRFRPHRGMDSDQRLCFSAVHTEDAYIDLRGAKYRSDKYVRELHTYTLTFRAGAQVGGRGDLPHSDVYGCYYVLTDAVLAHIEVHTTTTWCRAPPRERCR